MRLIWCLAGIIFQNRISCFGKLFTVIVNERLKKWALQNDIVTDAQFGFKADYSTIDAIFILESFISKTLRDKKKLYCAFVDLKRAFDSVYRNGLWYKMINFFTYSGDSVFLVHGNACETLINDL